MKILLGRRLGMLIGATWNLRWYEAGNNAGDFATWNPWDVARYNIRFTNWDFRWCIAGNYAGWNTWDVGFQMVRSWKLCWKFDRWTTWNIVGLR